MRVFDSSALIAWLRLERGAREVRRILRDHRGALFVHVINLCETYRHFVQWFGPQDAQRALGIIQRAGVVTREDVDPALWQEVATLIAEARRAGRGLAMGDAFGLALARRLGGEFVTGEHGEIDAIAAAGVYRVRFIR